MEKKNGKNIGKYVKFALAVIPIVISIGENGREFRDAIRDLKLKQKENE